MNKFFDFIEQKLAPKLLRIAKIRYLDAVQKSFVTFSPYLMISSFFMLAINLPIPGLNHIMAPYAQYFNKVVSATLGIIALGICMLIGYNLGDYYHNKDERVNKISTALISFVSFLLVYQIDTLKNGEQVVHLVNFGANGLFCAMIVAFISTEIYRLIIKKNLIIKMPAQVPPMISQSFLSIIPAFITILFWFLVVVMTSFDMFEAINKLFTPLLNAGSSPLTAFFAFMINRMLWFVGIHGPNVVASVMSPVWQSMFSANATAFAAGHAAKFLFTQQWMDNTIRLSQFPIAILLIMCKAKRYKTIGKMSIIPSIFNIGEPIIFGVPIALNPLLFIPWVGGYIIQFGVSYLFTGILHLVPPVVADVPWTIPSPIGIFLGTNGSIWALLVSCLNFVIMFFVWMPFIKILDRQESAQEEMEAALDIQDNEQVHVTEDDLAHHHGKA